MYVCCVYASSTHVHHIYLVPIEARRGGQMSWNWRYRWELSYLLVHSKILNFENAMRILI